MKIKVLVVGADIAVGGISGYVAQLVSLCNPDLVEFHMTVSGSQHRSTAVPQFEGVVKHEVLIHYSPWALPERVAQLRKLLKQERFDVLHLHAARAGLLGCLAATGLPVGIVYTGHGWRFEQKPDRIRQALFWVFERYIAARANVVVCITQRDKALGVARRLVNAHKAVVVHTRIDATRFAAVDGIAVTSQRRALGIPEQARVVGTVGRIVELKDPLTFIQAAARIRTAVPTSYFLWVGDGELKDRMLVLARELGLGDRVVITGPRPEGDIPVLLSTMDVYLCTSRIEVMPLSILEAQAAYRPVVSSAFPSVGEVVIHGKTGYTFPVGNAEAAAHGVVSVLKHREQAMTMARQAYMQFEVMHDGPSKMAEQYEEVYKRVRRGNSE